MLWVVLSCACYAQEFTSNLPIVIINTIGEPINDEPGVVVNFAIINNAGNVNRSTDPPNEYKGKAKAEFRGCTSQNFPKKSFGVELRDSVNTASDINVGLFGFPAEADWVLNASYTDKSFIREALPFYMSNLAGDYASRTKYVEVVLDGVYQGIYVFQEKIKRNAGRVNIKKMDPVDLALPKMSGGYILKIDKACGDEVAHWNTAYDSPGGLAGRKYGWGIDYPKPDNLQPQQLAYIKDYITQFEDVVQGSSACDSVNGYNKYIVESSFIDYILFQEMASNADAYRFSTFFSKDRDGKLRAGPIWDFGLAFGFLTNPLAGYAQNYQGWRYNAPGDASFPVPFFWEKLLKCAKFRQKLVTRYQELRAGALKTGDLTAFIDAQFATLNQDGGGAYQRNFQKWPILTTQVWTDVPSFVGGSLEAERDYLKTWLTNRLAWMDANIASIHPGEVVAPACDFNVTASPSTGTPSCSGAMSLTAECTGADCSGVGYQWSGNGIDLAGKSVNLNAPGSNGPYTYTVTASRNGCANKNVTGSITVSNCQPPVVTSQPYSLCLESENSDGNGPVTGDPNASAGKTRGAQDNYNHYVDYPVNGVGSAGVYQMKLRYYAVSTAFVSISVNGNVVAASVALPATHTWNIVSREETIPVTLGAGNNTVRIQGLPGATARQDRICVTGTGGGTQTPAVTCNFAISPTADRQSYTPQQAMSFNAGCTGADCGGTSFAWTGNGANASGSSANINAPASPGDYTYVLTASRTGCADKTANLAVHVAETPPTCNFNVTASPSTGTPSCSAAMSLTADCTGADCQGVGYQWSGNGVNLSGKSVNLNAPGSNGPYTYTVTASRNGCSNKTATASITVSGCQPPVVTSQSFSLCLEAEHSNGNGPVTDDPNASGGKTRGDQNNYNHYVDYAVNGVGSAGVFQLKLRYYANSAASVSISVNGNVVSASEPLPATFSWNIVWREQTINVALGAGNNTVRIQGLPGTSVRQDRICVTGSGTQTPTTTGETPPACNFNVTAGPSTGTPACSAAITLTADCTGADCSGVGYQWSGNGINLSGKSVNLNAPGSNGSFTYTVTASRNGCSNKTATASITVANCQPPVVTPGQALNLCLESENSDGNGPVTGDPNASGGKTRGEQNNYNHYVDYAVNGVGSAGVYQLTLRYYAAGNAMVSISVNGNMVMPSVTLPATHTWNIVSREETIAIALGAGNNTVRIQGLSGHSLRQDKICVTGGASGSARLAVVEDATADCPVIQAVNVFPNPAVSTFVVSFTHTRTGESTLTVVDMRGKVWHDQIIKGHGIHHETVRLHGAPAGIYLLKISQGDRAEMKKVLITN
ncbi:Por secretion system C-terminal sorting domain-containing protein [Dyadobacter sp. SG02]|nr:Por secretion system C-terminal sorting domain-containing protein [Dyadobacter sp. SG02]